MIGESIRHLREEYVERENLPDIKSINNGLCIAFAIDIVRKIEGSRQMSNDCFTLHEDWFGQGEDPLDEKLLIEVDSYPPAPYTMEMVNQIGGYHRWIYHDGKHYDAECPEGVINFFELPFFKEWMEKIYEENKKTQRH